MTEQEWLKQYDDTVDNFNWFIKRYFTSMWDNLCNERKAGNWQRMFTMMNHIWIALPDNQFNIIENPKGWDDFLYLLESPPES